MTLPLALRGKASMNRTLRGTLKPANVFLHWASTSSAISFARGCKTTKARKLSPNIQHQYHQERRQIAHQPLSDNQQQADYVH
jgi:hypothetical protein